MIMHASEMPEDLGVLAPTEEFFGEKSPLIGAFKDGGSSYESRPQQVEMAHFVATAFEQKHNLCIEAPTGVGKSFAYLVPAVYFSLQNDFPVIISTETISLQEQLISKDIPLIKGLVDVEFSAVLAKGRSNYLCRRRLSMLAGQHGDDYLPIKNLKPQVEDIALFAENMTKATRGDFDFEIDNRVWGGICCELGNCAGPKCPYFRSCCYWKERRAWEKADIIVANHALLFTDLKIKSFDDAETSLLPQYGAIIFDEAHLLEDCAANHLGLRVSSIGLKFLLNKLFDPERQRGALLRSGEACLAMRSIVADAHTAVDKFFNAINDAMLEKRKDELRLFEPGFVQDSISVPMGNLEKILRDFIRIQENDDFKQELTALLQKCAAYHSEVFDFINMEREKHVYWIEKKHSKRENIILNGAPLNVNVMLQDLMFAKDFPVILTSATLSVNSKLDYYRARTGFMNGPEVSLGSPFDYQKQVQLYASRKIPQPKEDGYEHAIQEQVRYFINATHGKAFVLFTSYYLLQQTADALRDFFEDKGIKLFVQGEGKNRTAMLNEFRKDIDSVIFGTSSFWMGVDVPGESLSNVIITKLPFAVPTHPLIQARAELIEGNGKSSFMHYQLPEAILKFKQGTGRLIRSKKDTGIIVILDSRILTKQYGSMFINSIPECPLNIY
jgi:ATP-dependent DNA helicase DinG